MHAKKISFLRLKYIISLLLLLLQTTFEAPGSSGGKMLAVPSIKTTRMSLMMVKVVPRTNKENKKVQIGSAILYSGCTKDGG